MHSSLETQLESGSHTYKFMFVVTLSVRKVFLLIACQKRKRSEVLT